MHAYPTTVPGYPRVGPNRVYKTLLEKYWSGEIDAEAFGDGVAALRRERLQTQAELGLEWIPVGDFSLYDHVLDTALQFGCIPERFGWDGGPIDPALYFAIARGRDGVPPLEMTKWFDTNYHYLVPELPSQFGITANRALSAYQFARSVVGERAKPVVLGPMTFLKLARVEGEELRVRLETLVPLYTEILRDLVTAGANLVQIDEPVLAGDLTFEEVTLLEGIYRRLGTDIPGLILQTYYGDVSPYWPSLRDLPVAGFGLDFVRGRQGNLSSLGEYGYPKGKVLVAGVVDGRNVWRTDLDDAYALVETIAQHVSPERIHLGASCTLLHLPETLDVESTLPPTLKGGLGFAQERIKELRLLSSALTHGIARVQAEWDATREAIALWKRDPLRTVEAVQTRVAQLDPAREDRAPYAERDARQRAHINLPLLPTTTIGSFPQTSELRKVRALRKSDEAGYQAAIKAEIERVVRLQEEIGLDVLVHGEPERNDMVQFFGDQMRGFTTTTDGWVQSYGSRCVRPPILFGDIERLGRMTVRETAYAQSLTEKPMKGMLTGPITILQWSFVREDIPRAEVAYQIALAISDEVADLEDAGLSIIQIDEAAYREGLPLRLQDRPAYIAWAVRAFRIATARAKPETQIHTHMCYSEFGDMIDAIDALGADVISIEDARSDGALLETLRDYRYPRQLGPGVYDIHSPNVPSIEFIEGRLRATLERLPATQVWVNPDCGLKTRRYEEVVPALQNMVEAARKVRQERESP